MPVFKGHQISQIFFYRPISDMNHIRSSLVVAFLAFPAAAQTPPFTTDYIPGAVLQAGQPVGSGSGTVLDNEPLKFTSPLDQDFVYLRDGEAWLVHDPARFERYISLGSGVGALAVMPRGNGLDAVLVTTSSGLSVVEGNSSDPTAFVTTVIPLTSLWSNVTRMAVAPNGAGYTVYGYDPVASLMRTVGQTNNVWDTPLTKSLPSTSTLRDMFSLQFDDSQSPQAQGMEILLLFDGGVFVMSADLSFSHLAAAAYPTDVAGKMQSPTPGEEMLLWVTQWNGQTHLIATTHSGANFTALGNKLFTDIESFDLKIEVDPEPPAIEVVLAGASGDVRILSRNPTNMSAPFVEVPVYGNTIDTMEPFPATRPDVSSISVADCDLDGDDDLFVTHAGTAEVRFWTNIVGVWEEGMRLKTFAQTIVPEPVSGSQVAVLIPVLRNQHAQTENFEQQVWVLPSYQQGGVPVPLGGKTIVSNANEQFFVGFTYDTMQWTGDPVFIVLIGGIDYVGNPANITKYYPVRTFYYTPNEIARSGHGTSVTSSYPVPNHTTGWVYEYEDPGCTTGNQLGGRVPFPDPPGGGS